ncbi:hypothetical protein CcCBS67573_g07473 [Chytriomyces confervae]|uniref:Uncharacterized protein n=1 Tax=Chytriomyces confervae TaxID=246404 RepID=A0A507EUB8_9FUNG|nr:hypothetical protein HDU80_005194 [Chytriomyces hyalinus]TPX67471.1 hypothetical protein CcCBS67573_g07473 [Chytriomyces confervae]
MASNSTAAPPIPTASIIDRAGMMGITCALTVMTFLLTRAIPLWWAQKTSVIKGLNVLQITIEFISYFLAVLFRFVNPRDICMPYRIFIDVLYYYGFTTAIEGMLLLKAQAMFSNQTSKRIVVAFGIVLALVRLGLGAATVAYIDFTQTYNAATYTCFSKYDLDINPIHSQYRIFCDVILSALFLVPLFERVRSSENESAVESLYLRLFADGVIYPMVAFVVALAITLVQMKVSSTAPYTQLLYACVNISVCGSMHMMVENTTKALKKSADDRAKNEYYNMQAREF